MCSISAELRNKRQNDRWVRRKNGDFVNIKIEIWNFTFSFKFELQCFTIYKNLAFYQVKMRIQNFLPQGRRFWEDWKHTIKAKQNHKIRCVYLGIWISMAFKDLKWVMGIETTTKAFNMFLKACLVEKWRNEGKPSRLSFISLFVWVGVKMKNMKKGIFFKNAERWVINLGSDILSEGLTFCASILGRLHPSTLLLPFLSLPLSPLLFPLSCAPLLLLSSQHISRGTYVVSLEKWRNEDLFKIESEQNSPTH